MLEFRNINREYIKQWPNWESEIPQKRDIVILHFGDNNEEAEEYVVLKRIIDGTNSHKIIIIVDDEEQRRNREGNSEF